MATKSLQSSSTLKKYYDSSRIYIEVGLDILGEDSAQPESDSGSSSLQTKLTFPNISKSIDFKVLENQTDGNQVMEFFNDHSYTTTVFEDTRSSFVQGREPFCTSTQVTTQSLINDGMDIVNYLKLNRYALDMNGGDYDLCDQFQESFEHQSDDINVCNLKIAVDRLRLIQSQLYPQ